MMLQIKDRATGLPVVNTSIALKLNNSKEYTDFKTDELGQIHLPIATSDSLAQIAIAVLGYFCIPECSIPVWDKAVLEIDLQPLQLNKTLVFARLSVSDKGKKLVESDYRSLDNLIQFLNQNPKVQVDLKNHADSKHGHYFNQRLSEKKARLIVSYLIQNGIDPVRINSISYGDTYPLIQCGEFCSQNQYAENSRTEVVFFNGDFKYQPYQYPDFDIEMQAIVHTGSKVTLLGSVSDGSNNGGRLIAGDTSTSDSLEFGEDFHFEQDIFPFYYLVAGVFVDLNSAYAWANYLRGNFSQEVFVLPPVEPEGKFMVALHRYAHLNQALQEMKGLGNTAPHLKIWLYHLE